MEDIWKPHVVVAAIIEHRGRFLLVEEETDDGVRLNQPAGHLEPGESLLDAVCREALEETTRVFLPQALVGVYRLQGTAERPSFIRFAFCGSAGRPDSTRSLDRGILRVHWLAMEEVRAERARHRSPLVMRCIEDYLSGHRFPLGMLHDCPP